MSVRNAPRAIIAVIAAVAAVLPFLAAPAHAAPNEPRPHARVQSSRDHVIVTVANASVSREDHTLVLRDRSGRVLERFPLTFIAPDDRTYPIDADVSGRTVRLTPSRDLARSSRTDAALLEKVRVADANGYKSKDERDDAALSRLSREVTTGATVSTVIGAALGAVLGGAAGCLFGLAAGPLGCFFAGVPLGATAGAGLGVIISGGVAGAAVLHYFDTVNRPFKDLTPPTSTSPSTTARASSATPSKH
ncbi:hypothetical protein ACE11G_02495 [Gordonia sp. PS3]|uniref:hypothetical protein n=1 Tax=Gordonia TaxID=2053 RepID=UPI001C92D42B|nr:hypothetical protein [Gordonia sihwensis]